MLNTTRRLVVGAIGLMLLATGCGSPNGTTGAPRAQLALSGEYSGGLQTNRPQACSYSPYDFAFDIVGIIGGHVLQFRVNVMQLGVRASAESPLLPSVEGDNHVGIPPEFPVDTADQFGGYPGDGLLPTMGARNFSVLLDELTTERHYLGGTVHIDTGGHAGSVSLSDSRLRIEGTWNCA